MPSFSKVALAITSALSISASLTLAQDVPAFQYGSPNPNAPGVKGRNSNGPTNPWCTKPRNNARVIPDGTLTATHFVKTPLYVQVMALGDFTKMNIMAGDDGGELDPHGATNMGNPIGGNVTSNVSGEDVFYEEWMSFVSYNQVCIRVCTAGTDIAPTPLECQHELDVMGCNWVMPGDYSDNKFDSCEGDAAYPPGLYPQGDGSTSTFHQYYSAVFPDGSGNFYTFVNGSPDQATPSAAYSLPATSNCQTTSSVGNGIASLVEEAVATVTLSSMASSITPGASSSTGSSSTVSKSTSARNASNSSDTSDALPLVSINFAAIAGVVGAIAGGVALL